MKAEEDVGRLLAGCGEAVWGCGEVVWWVWGDSEGCWDVV